MSMHVELITMIILGELEELQLNAVMIKGLLESRGSFHL